MEDPDPLSTSAAGPTDGLEERVQAIEAVSTDVRAAELATEETTEPMDETRDDAPGESEGRFLKRQYKPRKCPNCNRVVGFNYKKKECPECQLPLPEYISRRRGKREGRIEKWAKLGKRFKTSDFQPLKNEARKTAAKAAGSKAIVGCFVFYMNNSGVVSTDSFITEPGLEESMKRSINDLQKRSDSLFNDGGIELWSLYHDLKKKKLTLQQLAEIQQLTANIGDKSTAPRIQPQGIIHPNAQFHGQMLEQSPTPNHQPVLHQKYPSWH